MPCLRSRHLVLGTLTGLQRLYNKELVTLEEI